MKGTYGCFKQKFMDVGCAIELDLVGKELRRAAARPEGIWRPSSRARGTRASGRYALELGPPGRWWNNPDAAKRVGSLPDQVKKMDDIFTANRLKLIDRMAAVQKEETIMEPLVAADPPDENKVLTQIDKVAQARAELEKANARICRTSRTAKS